MRNVVGNARVNYQEHAVPDALRTHVAAVWRLGDEAPADTVQTIYPDGHCELIVHLGAPPDCWEERTGWHPQARTLFAGQRLSAVRLRSAAALDCLGLRLQPEASGLAGADTLKSTRERIVDLAGVDPALSAALTAAAKSFADGDAAPLWQLLRQRVTSVPIDATVAAAVAELRDTGGQQRIERLRRNGLGLRSLQTRFRRAVGLTPKEFGRVMRLQATLRALDAGDASLSDVATDTGFSDQAHVTRELRRVTGLAPARLRSALRADRDGDVAVRLAAAFVRSGARRRGQVVT
jgi:AraC-like DNA-binding protein